MIGTLFNIVGGLE